jgi:hypothetical protein
MILNTTWADSRKQIQYALKEKFCKPVFALSVAILISFAP